MHPMPCMQHDPADARLMHGLKLPLQLRLLQPMVEKPKRLGTEYGGGIPELRF
ncbi:hypothetical protein J31TS3_15000 [Paenibacillus lactis]|nr:hypothetical protein J31TS3_15000 [Paenibacillus lactis]